MPKQQQTPVPRRKEPGLMGKSLSATVQLASWLIISLLLSILIEWIGINRFWAETGSNHAKTVLAMDQRYLNQSLKNESLLIKGQVISATATAVNWIAQQSWLTTLSTGTPTSKVSMGSMAAIQKWIHSLSDRYQDYWQAANYVAQTFVVRLALIFFSLPIFLFAGVVGAVDGLVERDLRRWGGGRESSNVFNLAKKSITPAFVLACVVYISLPYSVNPVIVILPFAILLGLAVRISFERLKKYF
jgi:integrating conjugative element membrane protein (TIGR03747 family)